MYDLSQLLLIPAPWQINISILIVYGTVSWLVFWSSNFLRRETENFVRWPLQCMAIFRVVGTFFGFASDSPHTNIASQQYLLVTFTYLWDLGFAFLMLEVICSIGMIYRLRKNQYFRTIQCGWFGFALLVLTIAHASQASNVTKAIEGADIFSKIKRTKVVPMSMIQICLRIYFVLCTISLGALTGAAIYAVVILRRRKTFSSADVGQLWAFFLALGLLIFYTGYGGKRLWNGKAPTILMFSLCQGLPEAIAAWIYLTVGSFISRWDHARQTELHDYRRFAKRYWEEILLDALSYARAVSNRGYNPNRPTPWIVSRAEVRYGILAAPKDKNQDMIACLVHLQQLADVVADRLVLEEDLRMSLLSPRETRRVNLSATMKAVIEELMVRFRPMTRNAAEILSRDWCPVFSMDRNAVRQWGESRLASGS